jgi:hypothetical protein
LGRPVGPEGEDRGLATDVLTDLPAERRLDEQQTAQLRADLARVAPAVAHVRKLADMPEGRYPVAWTADVIFTPCPWSDTVYSTQDLLELDAVLRAQDGDVDGALVSARALLNLGRSLGDEPFFGAATSRSGSRLAAARAIERALAQGQPSEGALATMQESVANEDRVELLLTHFRGDRAMLHIFLTRVDAGQNRLSELG